MAIIRDGILFCLVGPSGCGKSSLGERLLNVFSDTLQISVSATSRAPRAGEVPGKAYFFLSRAQFEKEREEGAFFEWEQIHGELYGTYQHILNEAISGGTDLLLDVDIKGALNFRRCYPKHTVIVFIAPPSGKVLLARLNRRGPMDPEELRRRLATAVNEYAVLRIESEQSDRVDYLLINDDFEQSLVQLRSIVEAERLRFDRLERLDIARLGDWVEQAMAEEISNE